MVLGAYRMPRCYSMPDTHLSSDDNRQLISNNDALYARLIYSCESNDTRNKNPPYLNRIDRLQFQLRIHLLYLTSEVPYKIISSIFIHFFIQFLYFHFFSFCKFVVLNDKKIVNDNGRTRTQKRGESRNWFYNWNYSSETVDDNRKRGRGEYFGCKIREEHVSETEVIWSVIESLSHERIKRFA